MEEDDNYRWVEYPSSCIEVAELIQGGEVSRWRQMWLYVFNSSSNEGTVTLRAVSELLLRLLSKRTSIKDEDYAPLCLIYRVIFVLKKMNRMNMLIIIKLMII